MTLSTFSPAWLGRAVQAVLDRLRDQRNDPAARDSSQRMEQVAALWEREACCWRVLAQHASEPVVWSAMFAAELRAENFAERYRGFARTYRDSEARAAQGRGV
ncbi:hypothetical protein MOQ72_41900 [Saccharopolyspora sp. K220]|uniref:hypothetical protein n=1 Tax=Saccharopolyspora soli TaxID=2926618 RepID=UPI001F59EC53|nr:hypothetical protein [Saccharopolyspora soli]MCI2423973.1 hypothetical protein [Saccharopolyspora soli]